MVTASQTHEHVSLLSNREVKLSFGRKIAFAIGGATSALTSTVLAFFLAIYLLEVAEVEPLYVSVIVFSGRAWDAITDPLIGYLCSRTHSKRFGQLRPWLLFSIVPMAAFYIGIWIVPSFPNTGTKVLYYLVMYCGFQTALSAYHVPYTALTMHLSTKNEERDSATAYRMAVELASTLIAAIVQGLILSAKVTKPECTAGQVDKPWLTDEKDAYMIAAFTVAAIATICALVAFLGIREQKGILLPKPLSLWKGLKFVLHHRPYVYLTMFYLFSWLGTQVVAGNFSLFIEYVMNLRGKFQNFIIVLLVSACVAMPGWQLASIKIGKTATFVIGVLFSFPGLISLLYITPNLVSLMYALAALAGLGTAVSYLIPWSMLPDVIDDAELEFGERRESLFYAFFVFFQKFAVGVSLGLSTVALQVFGGYETGACEQPESVSETLRVLLAAPPVVLNVISFWFVWKYPINKARAFATRKTLLESGGTAVDT
ncbi:sodium-dependent lysophosphatidylcholine symporter 1-like [Sycon ciliatum]|uniref:sodium-dependent lysophosphatidylcholine symporter 1-like n=1 Tax=Sycon ciliatum TaxID=27933 RepID=UPI0020AAFCA6|eukprot:scpid52437/ scgid11523/ Major facilitator superfamily domain-containing protein 2A-A